MFYDPKNPRDKPRCPYFTKNVSFYVEYLPRELTFHELKITDSTSHIRLKF